MSEIRVGLASPDPAAIARDYAPQFAASEALLAAMWESLPQRGHNDFDLVLMNVLGRSIGTYRALLHLLKGGFTDQAWMLNRPLFEDMVFGYWIALPANRETARSLVSEHMEDVNDRIDYLVERIHTGGFAALAERPDPEKDWPGRALLVRSLDKRVNDIKELWVKCGGTLDELFAHREVTHWMSNLTMHTTGRSLLDALGRGAVRTPRGSLYAYGQSSQVEEDRMLHGFEFSAFRIGWLARLVLLEAGRSVEALETSYNNLTRAVQEWAPSKRARVGQNDPCWCGSGKKFKKCHWLSSPTATV